MSESREFVQSQRDRMQNGEFVVEGGQQSISDVFGPLISLIYHDAPVDCENDSHRCSPLVQRSTCLSG